MIDGVALACAAMLAAADTARPAPPADAWLGADKTKHALLAGFAYAVSFSGMRLAGLDRRAALATAAVPVAIVSIGKEARDRRRGGRFSVRDLLADAVGAAAYAAIVARTAR